jgi:murein tripeptide amidase MpaA
MATRTHKWHLIFTLVLIGLLTIPNISHNNLDYISMAKAEDPKPLAATVYHSFDEMEAELNQIVLDHPSITKMESIGTTYEGRNIWAVKVSDNPDVEEDEPEVVFNAMHHAREWMTMEVVLYILNYLTDNYGTNSTITSIVNNRQIWLIPCVNPDGRVYDSAEDDPTNHRNQPSGWRKNRVDHGEGARGVDLNRNYGYMWGGTGARESPFSSTYRGPDPFSELETQAIRDFVMEHDFVFSVSYHSSGQLILYPWGYTYNAPEDEDLFIEVSQGMADRITNKADSPYPGYTPQQGAELYPTSGSDDDWLYGELGIFSFTIELYPHNSQNDAPVTSPYDNFHPNQDKVGPVCEDNLEAALFLAMIADNPYQVFDYHVSLSTTMPSQLINQSETGTFPIKVYNDGANEDFYDITTSSLFGWTISIDPVAVILTQGTFIDATLSVTPPPGISGGEYPVWVYVTSYNNASISDSLMVTVKVPYLNDVGIQSQSPFVNDGTYPMRDYSISSIVKNYGRNPQAGYNVSLEITKLGPPSIQTVFSDDMESGLNGWQVEDLDGSVSSSSWKQVTTSSNSPTTSWWCGNTTQYTNKAAQLLISPSFSLEWVNSADLLFYHKYKTENNYDYCSVDAFDGTTWTTLTSYDGVGPSSFEQASISLDDYIGYDDVRVRFRFTSDQGLVDDGWYIDDVEISVEVPLETTVFGPVINTTSGSMVQDAIQQLGWEYTFTETGLYKVYVTTLLDSDEYQDNNQSIVRIKIMPPDWDLIPLEFGWNLISLPLLQEDTTLELVLESIEGDYDAIQWHNKSDSADPWKHHQISKPANLWDLYWIDHEMGFWIHITNPGGTTLNTTGWELSSPESVTLHVGWNMVGYPSQNIYDRTTGLNNLAFGTDIDAIQWYDAASDSWYDMDAADNFVPGRGYWVHSMVETSWDVPN